MNVNTSPSSRTRASPEASALDDDAWELSLDAPEDACPPGDVEAPHGLAEDAEDREEELAPPGSGMDKGRNGPRARTGSPALPATDDAQLAGWIERIVDRDERALAALYDATVARVHGLVLRIVSRADYAEEVVEDVYFQVWRQAARFDAGKGRAMTWLLNMARTRAIDAWRKEARFAHAPMDEAHLSEPEPGLSHADLLDMAQGHAALHEALAGLQAQPRQLLALAFFRGLSHEEIAEQTALPLGTVKSQIRRALGALRARLDHIGISPLAL